MYAQKMVAFTMAAMLLGTISACTMTNSSPEDARITDSVTSTLKKSSIYHSVRVQTLDGVTYLYGTLDTPREVLEAQSIAAAAPGVNKIVSCLEYNSY